LSHSDQDTLPIVLLDQGSGHQAHALVIPAKVGCLFCPPDSPELNPIERRWQAVKEPCAWVVTAALEALAHRVAMLITHYANTAIRSLTSDPYFVHAVIAVCS
jgi:hypothetical protein